MQIENFKELYLAELSEAASLEQIWTKTAETLADKVTNKRLRDTLVSHSGDGRKHAKVAGDLLGKYEAGEPWHTDQSMERLSEEARSMVDMVDGGPLRDAAMIASIQRIKHYEIAVYGTLATYANCLGYQEDKKALGAILDEEKAFDATLTEIANEVVNEEALRQAT